MRFDPPLELFEGDVTTALYDGTVELLAHEGAARAESSVASTLCSPPALVAVGAHQRRLADALLGRLQQRVDFLVVQCVTHGVHKIRKVHGPQRRRHRSHVQHERDVDQPQSTCRTLGGPQQKIAGVAVAVVQTGLMQGPHQVHGAAQPRPLDRSSIAGLEVALQEWAERLGSDDLLCDEERLLDAAVVAVLDGGDRRRDGKPQSFQPAPDLELLLGSGSQGFTQRLRKAPARGISLHHPRVVPGEMERADLAPFRLLVRGPLGPLAVEDARREHLEQFGTKSLSRQPHQSTGSAEALRVKFGSLFGQQSGHYPGSFSHPPLGFSMNATVIIPTYQEQGNIEGIVSAVLAEGPEFRVLVVDDCSKRRAPHTAPAL